MINTEKAREYWRTVVIDGVEHPRYQVSNLGKVKCIDFRGTGKERICKLSVNGAGYLVACIDGKNMNVHRLLAEAFLPNPNPEEKHCIDHISTVRNLNFVILDEEGTIIDSSIRWCTQKENCNNPLTRKHMSENNASTMLGKLGAEHPKSVSIVQLTLDGQFIRKWGSVSEAERELGIHHSSISDCCRGRYKSAGGFHWVYAKDYRKSISQIKPLF